MRLKPRSTVKNPRALVYKRFIGIEKSLSLYTAYKTDGAYYWIFDCEMLTFTKVYATDFEGRATFKKIIELTLQYNPVLQYQDHFFQYDNHDSMWVELTQEQLGDKQLLSASFANIAKYQTNKYYFAGSFDFMIKGSIEGTTAQYIKGNIIPLSAMNIKYYSDDIKLSPDDLVVVGGRLYSVENPETVLKQMPKPFKIHFATLNSVL